MRTSRGLNRRVREQRIWSNSLGFDRIPLGHGEREREKREGRPVRGCWAGLGPVLGWLGQLALFLFFVKTFSSFSFLCFLPANRYPKPWRP